MSGNREEALANFQGCTGIENVEEAIMWLENANWDLLGAIRNAVPQGNMTQRITYGRRPRHREIQINGITTIDLDSSDSDDDEPSNSDVQQILEIHVHHLNNIYKLKVPDSMTVGCLKSVIASDSKIEPPNQAIAGWPIPPLADSVTLKALRMPNITQLRLTYNENQAMDVAVDATQHAARSSEENKEQEGRVETTRAENVSSGSGRRTKNGRLVKRLKRDNSKVLFDLKVFDEINGKRYTIKVSGCRTVGEVQKDLAGLTKVPVRQQVLSGWPRHHTTISNMSDLDLDLPFHTLVLHNTGEHSRQNNAGAPPPNVIAERIPSPIIIDLAGDTDSSPEDFEDAPESFVVEDEIFNEEVSSQNRITPLIPDNVEDETAGSVHFIDGYTLRYGQASPNFFPGPLEEAIKEACFKPAKERRMLAIYLHHDGSVLSNVFCTELLGFETVLQTFATYFVVWGWDITNRGNREMFLNSVTRHLGSPVTETVQSISPDLLPALMIISRSRSNTELLNVIYGNIGINELLTMLIQAVDVFTDMQETEIKEEEERAARERIKVEQDKAYQESLQMDRAKDEAKKQQLLLQTQEEERIKREQKLEEEKRQAERLAAQSQLPEEPTEATSSKIMTFRFRPPTVPMFTRKFLETDSLKTVFNYLVVKGFRVEEYKMISPWPTRKDLSTFKEDALLNELGLCYQETIILEER